MSQESAMNNLAGRITVDIPNLTSAINNFKTTISKDSEFNKILVAYTEQLEIANILKLIELSSKTANLLTTEQKLQGLTYVKSKVMPKVEKESEKNSKSR